MGENNRTKICVIDGQGGGMGAVIIKKLKERYEEKMEIIALGTNAIATARMLKSRANKGASGANAVIQAVKNTDVIIGPVGIIVPHAMMGEVTPDMAEAISSADARKILLPLTQENMDIVGIQSLPLPLLVDELLNKHMSFLSD